LFSVLLLAGEEIPDLIQKRASEHPDTDPLLRAVNRYHRAEEARHLAFARLTLRERWNAAGPVERFRVRYLAPFLIRTVFENMVHPGVYKTVALPGMDTWRAVNRTPQRVALRHEATRAVLRALCDAGVFAGARIPAPWQRLCGVDAHGAPAAA
jgi:P-aminobenzoate N-oxygenase AurF